MRSDSSGRARPSRATAFATAEVPLRCMPMITTCRCSDGLRHRDSSSQIAGSLRGVESLWDRTRCATVGSDVRPPRSVPTDVPICTGYLSTRMSVGDQRDGVVNSRCPSRRVLYVPDRTECRRGQNAPGQGKLSAPMQSFPSWTERPWFRPSSPLTARRWPSRPPAARRDQPCGRTGAPEARRRHQPRRAVWSNVSTTRSWSLGDRAEPLGRHSPWANTPSATAPPTTVASLKSGCI